MVIIKYNSHKRVGKRLTQLDQKAQGKENLRDDRTYSETKRPNSEGQKTAASEPMEAIKRRGKMKNYDTKH